MKNYEEMARQVLADRDRILAERRKRRKIAEKCCGGVLGACAVVLISVNIFSKKELMKPVSNDNVQTVTAAAEPTEKPSVTTSAAAQITQKIVTTTAVKTDPENVVQTTQTRYIQHITQLPEPARTTAVDTEKTVPAVTVTAAEKPVDNVTTTMQNEAPGVPPWMTKPVTSTDFPTVTTEPTTTAPDPFEGMPWSDLPFDFRYPELTLENGMKYRKSSGNLSTMVAPFLVTDYIGDGELVGYDVDNDEYRYFTSAAYMIKGGSLEYAIAVKGENDGEYYMYFYAE